jgi:hypothetical protein
LTELLGRPADDPDVQRARQATLEWPPALLIQRRQRKDGTWGGRIHAGDPRKPQTSLETMVTKLHEFGWQRETKPIKAAAKPLRGLLAVKKDLNFYEFGKAVKADPRRERHARWFLRVLSLGLLAQSGYDDERCHSGVLELLDRVAGFVDDPISRNPTEEIGASHPLIRSDAMRDGYAFIPDVHTVRAFAHSPWLLSGEVAKMRLKKIFDYILSPTYQAIAPDLGLVRTMKGSFLKGHGVQLQSLDHYHKHGNMDELLIYMELLARLGLINRYPLLMGHLEWLQTQQTKEGRWNLATKLLSDASRWIVQLRVERDWRSPIRKESDLTFRVLLIFKHQWEAQIRMLDRHDDAYPI